MPEGFYDVASRVDHLLSALLPGRIEKLNISHNFDLSIKFPTECSHATNLSINDVSASLPFSYEINHGNWEQTSVDYGFTSICSLYKNNLNSLTQKVIRLKDSAKVSGGLSNEVLFVAECSDKPRLAVFIEYKNNSNDFEQIKVFTAGHFFTMSANEPVITFEGETHNIKEATFEYPQFQSDFK